jgi:arylsulfatase A-like enzyme
MKIINSFPFYCNYSLTFLKRTIGFLIVAMAVTFATSYGQQKNPYPQYHFFTRKHITANTLHTTPNIIVILTDDMGYGDISADGGPYHTPHIDRLAAHGLQITHYYSPAPICSASRVGLLTGMAPAEWNFHAFEGTRKVSQAIKQAPYLDPIAPTIARTLKQQAGYATAHIGKWHMGGSRDVYNAPKFAEYGFDVHHGTYESPEPDPLITATNWIWSPQDSIKRWQRTAYFVSKTLQFLRLHKGTPCYVDLWPDDMHTPWVPNKKQQSIYPKGNWSEKSFEAVLKPYDKQIGRLIAGLKKLGIYKNTLIIFTSDNGPYPTFGGKRTNGMRGSKFSLYQGGNNMPFIVEWPGHVPEGKVDSTSVVSGLDIFPTLASIIGVPLPSRYHFDGESRKGVWLGHPSKRTKPLYWEYGSFGKKSAYIYPSTSSIGRGYEKKDNAKGYRKGKGAQSKNRSPNLAIQQGKWKLLINYDGSNEQLYNLKADPDESNNILELHQNIANKLKEKLIRWRNNLPKIRNNTVRY